MMYGRLFELTKIPRCRYDGEMEDPNNFVGGLIDLLLKTRPKSVIEIGSDQGVSTEVFLLLCDRVVAVDPWYSVTPRHAFDNAVGRYTNLEVVQGYSPQALDRFDAGEFDLAYIDGAHTYDNVRADIIASQRVVRRGGWIGGHDFHMEPVARAILSLLPHPMLFNDGSWLVAH